MTDLVPDNFILSKQRLSSLKHKLDCNQKLKLQYNDIGYEKDCIMQKKKKVCNPGTSHYVPHQAVIKENCDISEVRIVIRDLVYYLFCKIFC